MANDIKNVNGKLVTLTDKEQKELDAIKKEWIDGKADRDLSELRKKRNTLLSETDWWASSDLTKYRQDLRDITKTYQSLSDKDFKFPTKPTE